MCCSFICLFFCWIVEFFVGMCIVRNWLFFVRCKYGGVRLFKCWRYWVSDGWLIVVMLLEFLSIVMEIWYLFVFGYVERFSYRVVMYVRFKGNYFELSWILLLLDNLKSDMNLILIVCRRLDFLFMVWIFIFSYLFYFWYCCEGLY